MSATMLTFPRKPNELADDLESFIYVISIALARFHKHQWTLPTPSVINNRLSKHVHFTYYASHKTVDGYWVGDDAKLENMCEGNPRLKLANPNSSLAVLLRELFRLGKEHYSQLDLDELKTRWGVGARASRLRDDNDNREESGHYGKDATDNFDENDAISWEGLMPSYLKTAPLVLPEDPPPEVKQPSQQPTRDLNSHDHIIGVFALMDQTQWNDTDGGKTWDQFSGVESFVLDIPTGSTRGLKRSSQAISSSNTPSEPTSKKTRTRRSGVEAG